MMLMHQEKPEALAYRRARWMKPDWRERKQYSQPLAAEAADDGGLSVAELRGAQARLAHLRWLLADLKFDLTLRRLARKYSPDQPRVPAGNPDGGQWTSDGSSEGRIRLAGEIPTNDPPKFPKERPPTSAGRTAALKAAARLLGRFGGPIGKVIEIGSWAYSYLPIITSYGDPPRALEELQRAVSTPATGYDLHHIVEQTQAERDGFTREAIDARENLVRIPTIKHWEINGWYQRKNSDFGGLTPRQYLSGRNWEVRRAVGLKALRIHGVLNP
jgi:hypothetical protein